MIKGRDATVDAFRNLTAYDVVVVRCHGAYFKASEVLGGGFSAMLRQWYSRGRSSASAYPSPASTTSRG
ncbi:MAG: hypothetical protein QXK45_06995 [Thermofilaceae archaeon]